MPAGTFVQLTARYSRNWALWRRAPARIPTDAVGRHVATSELGTAHIAVPVAIVAEIGIYTEQVLLEG
jgi:hypothetical protein